jgi:hypothetical protein
MLDHLVSAIEIAFERDPPGETNRPWEGLASRFHEMESDTPPARGAKARSMRWENFSVIGIRSFGSRRRR